MAATAATPDASLLDEPHYSIKELALIYGVSESWWRRKVLERAIQYKKFGSAVRIPRSAVLAAITTVDPR